MLVCQAIELFLRPNGGIPFGNSGVKNHLEKG
jgi:hypothetical protein